MHCYDSVVKASRVAWNILPMLLLDACARHYHAQGIVLAVDRNKDEVTISHKAIPGYMEAMAMPFHADSPKELEPLAPGSRIEFQLKVSRRASSVGHIRVQSAPPGDVPLPKPVDKIAVGQTLPDFTLTDQSGRSVNLSSFRGQVVALDFIYTRCPLPDVCPRLSANFARLQKRFPGRIALLSITLDPDYDTPAVLSDYAHRWNADPSMWRFLTGNPDEVQKVAGHFGVVYWPEDNAITHTAATAIIGRDGRLAALLEGASFTSQQLIDLVQATFTTL